VALPWPAVDEGPARVGPCAPAACGRVLIAGVGYRNLRDLSVGPLLIDRLHSLDWPTGVELEDLSFGAVHVLHWLQEQPPFDAVCFVAGVRRGRPPGSAVRSAWSAPRIAAEVVQESIAEAVTGVISLDALLVVLGYFEALPGRVSLIEIEPRDEDWGAALSPPVQLAMAEAEQLVRLEVQSLVA